MEPTVSTAARSGPAALESLQFGEEIQRLMAAPPPETAGSFTALLELPPTRAMELLHSPGQSRRTHLHPLPANPTFPTSTASIERAAEFSAFAGEPSSPEMSSVPSSSNASLGKVKSELVDTGSNPDSSPELLVSEPPAKSNAQKAAKRKEREKKAKGSTKKSKLEEAEKLPYVHVRARRGQATDSHSLAERARREKINARMKLLQELVPGCTKISGTTLVLDEIISHVQSLQRQVEFLSMRLAEVDPRIDFNLDSMLSAESGSLMDSNLSGMLMPLMWPEGHVNGGSRQQWHVDAVQQPVWQREEDNHNLITSENSLLRYDSGNSAAHQSSQLKMEL